jgi:matrixin
MILNRRGRGAAAVAALVGLAAPGAASPASSARHVLVVTSDAGDARIELVREAILFWRDTFAELDLEPPLVEAGVVVAPPGLRPLENFAWQTSRAAGRLPEGVSGPPAPPELLALDGDVVVLLSKQHLLPFARPLLPDSARYLVAIPAARDTQPAGVARNIIAHELGHSLGLRHGDDPTSLMCEPCSTAPADGGPAFRPLTAAHRARLVELYRSRPEPP